MHEVQTVPAVHWSHSCRAAVTTPVAAGPTTYLVDEGVGPLRAQQQDGTAQRVPVAVQLFRLHCGEKASKHMAYVLVHLL